MYKVFYVKTFVTGMLKGTDFQSCLTFHNLDSASDFIDFLGSHRVKPVQSFAGADYTCKEIRILEVK